MEDSIICGTLSCIARGDEILMRDPVSPNQHYPGRGVPDTQLDRADLETMGDQKDRREHRRND
jgi:hypothetical protein